MPSIKHLVSILVIVFFQFMSFEHLTAQNCKTSIGIAISPGFSTFYDKFDNELLDNRFVISGGLNIRHDIANEKIFLLSGLNYTCRGFANENLITDIQGNIVGTIKGEESYHYVELPLSAAYNLNGFFIGGGISFNYLVKRKFIVDGTLIST